MLLTLKEILALAEERSSVSGAAIGAFNTPNLECLRAVIRTSEKLNAPIIIMHADPHDVITPLEIIGPVMVSMAKNAATPVCVHLDHGESLEFIQRALEIGFTSVMYDGSRHAYEENVEKTSKTVEMAREFGASVEGEIGTMLRDEFGTEALVTSVDQYTDPELAARFVKDTGIDALACAFGTVHGFYTSVPKLDIDRIGKIKRLINLPIVMHGGSGVSRDDYRRAIDAGVRKINYYTYMSNAGLAAAKAALAERDLKYFHELAQAAEDGMAADAERAMRIFYNV